MDFPSGALWTPKATKQCPKNLSSKSHIVLMNTSSNVNPPYFEHMYLPHLKKNNLHGYGCTKWRFIIPFFILKVTKDCPKILSFSKHQVFTSLVARHMTKIMCMIMHVTLNLGTLVILWLDQYNENPPKKQD